MFHFLITYDQTCISTEASYYIRRLKTEAKHILNINSMLTNPLKRLIRKLSNIDYNTGT